MKYLPYSGIAELSGDKSIIQRYLFMASLFPFKTVLKPGSVCDDVWDMAEAVKACGAKIGMTADAISIDSSEVNIDKATKVKFKGSATALRFWLARAFFVRAESAIEVSWDLALRPVTDFLDELDVMGCQVDYDTDFGKEYNLKAKIIPPKTVPDEVTVDANISSQFISGLMLAGRLAQDHITINFRQIPVSYSYLQMTKLMMQNLNVNVCLEESFALVQGGKGFRFQETTIIEPELAGGAFFMVLSVFSKSGIMLKTASKYRWHPDWEIITILLKMGAEFTVKDGKSCLQAKKLYGLEHDMQNYPDLVPLAAVLALFADSPSVLTGINRLQFKESDRIKGILQAFEQIGAGFVYAMGSLKIYPYKKKPTQVTLDTQNDHRLVIAFTLLKLHFSQIELSETESVKKSCPDFFKVLSSLKQQT